MHRLEDILKTDSRVSLNVDNQGAIKLAKNPMFHKRSKHIDIRYHFIRNELQQGTMALKYVASENNLADVFTKPMSKNKLDKFILIMCN